MRKFLKITSLLLIICLICPCLASCGLNPFNDNPIKSMADNVANAKSAALKTNFTLDAKITDGKKELPFTALIDGDGVVVTSPYKEDFRYTSKIKLYNEITKQAFATSATEENSTFSAVIKEDDKDYTPISKTASHSDVLLKSVFESIKDNTEKEEENKYAALLSGEALENVVNLCMNANFEYDISSFSWNTKTADVSIVIDEDKNLPVSLTVDCRSFANQLAEAIANKSGIRITIEECTATVTFSDFNIISEIDLPDVLKSTDLFTS